MSIITFMKNLKSSKQDDKWCLFEDHIFNTQTKSWELIDSTRKLRRCLHSKCARKHKLPNRPIQVCKRETDCPDAGLSCFLLHNNTKLEPICRWGKACIDLECSSYRHPKSRNNEICPLDEKCPDALITCFKLHTMSKLIPLCHYKNECVNYICQKRHPPERTQVCEEGSMCWGFITQRELGCNKLHPKILQRACKWSMDGGECYSYGCPFVHPLGASDDCMEGMQCSRRIAKDDTRCMNKHPK